MDKSDMENDADYFTIDIKYHSNEMIDHGGYWVHKIVMTVDTTFDGDQIGVLEAICEVCNEDGNKSIRGGQLIMFNVYTDPTALIQWDEIAKNEVKHLMVNVVPERMTYLIELLSELD